MKVADVMNTAVITVPPEMEIKEIARILVNHKISGVPVVDGEDHLLGIVSEGDLLHKESSPRAPEAISLLGALIYYRGVKQYEADYKKLFAMQASEIMSSEVIVTHKDATVEEAATLMIQEGVKRLPVLEENKLIGIVSRIDLIRALIED